MELVPWASSSCAKCWSYHMLPHMGFASLYESYGLLEKPRRHSQPKGCWEKANSLFGRSTHWTPWRRDSSWEMVPWERWSPENPPGPLLPSASASNPQPPCSSLWGSPSPCGGCRPRPVLSFPGQDPQAGRPACLREGMNIYWARNFTALASCNPHSKPAGGHPELSVDQLGDPEQTTQPPMIVFSSGSTR